MNKAPLLIQIKQQLALELKNAMQAAEQARLAATDDQSVAETQYDTLAIEASFLAHGQSQRAQELTLSIATIDQMIKCNAEHQRIQIGSLVCLADDNDQLYYYFMAAVGGGIQCQLETNMVTVITPNSPLGLAMFEKEKDDDVLLIVGNKHINYSIEDVY